MIRRDDRAIGGLLRGLDDAAGVVCGGDVGGALSGGKVGEVAWWQEEEGGEVVQEEEEHRGDWMTLGDGEEGSV